MHLLNYARHISTHREHINLRLLSKRSQARSLSAGMSTLDVTPLFRDPGCQNGTSVITYCATRQYHCKFTSHIYITVALKETNFSSILQETLLHCYN